MSEHSLRFGGGTTEPSRAAHHISYSGIDYDRQMPCSEAKAAFSGKRTGGACPTRGGTTHSDPQILFFVGEIMNAWLALLGAGLLEVGWALGLKYSDGLTRFWPTAATVVAILLSFALMALALRSLPFGTAYAIWTGIGAVGSIIVGMLLYSEPTDLIRIICLTLIVAGMVGLKLNSPV